MNTLQSKPTQSLQSQSDDGLLPFCPKEKLSNPVFIKLYLLQICSLPFFKEDILNDTLKIANAFNPPLDYNQCFSLDRVSNIRSNILMNAAMKGTWQSLNYLLNTNLFDIRVCDQKGNNILFYALRNTNHHQYTKMITEIAHKEGIDSELLSATNQDGQTLLMLLVDKCQVDLIKLILETKVDINAKIVVSGQTALHLAIQKNGSVPRQIIDEIIGELLQKGADMNIEDSYGHSCVKNAQTYLIDLQKILKNHKSSKNDKNKSSIKEQQLDFLNYLSQNKNSTIAETVKQWSIDNDISITSKSLDSEQQNLDTADLKSILLENYNDDDNSKNIQLLKQYQLYVKPLQFPFSTFLDNKKTQLQFKDDDLFDNKYLKLLQQDKQYIKKIQQTQEDVESIQGLQTLIDRCVDQVIQQIVNQPVLPIKALIQQLLKSPYNLAAINKKQSDSEADNSADIDQIQSQPFYYIGRSTYSMYNVNELNKLMEAYYVQCQNNQILAILHLQEIFVACRKIAQKLGDLYVFYIEQIATFLWTPDCKVRLAFAKNECNNFSSDYILYQIFENLKSIAKQLNISDNIAIKSVATMNQNQKKQVINFFVNINGFIYNYQIQCFDDPAHAFSNTQLILDYLYQIKIIRPIYFALKQFFNVFDFYQSSQGINHMALFVIILYGIIDWNSKDRQDNPAMILKHILFYLSEEMLRKNFYQIQNKIVILHPKHKDNDLTKNTNIARLREIAEFFSEIFKMHNFIKHVKRLRLDISSIDHFTNFIKQFYEKSKPVKWFQK